MNKSLYILGCLFYFSSTQSADSWITAIASCMHNCTKQLETCATQCTQSAKQKYEKLDRTADHILPEDFHINRRNHCMHVTACTACCGTCTACTACCCHPYVAVPTGVITLVGAIDMCITVCGEPKEPEIKKPKP